MKIEVLTEYDQMLKSLPLIQQLNPSMSGERYAELLKAIVRQSNYFQIACLDDGNQVRGVTGIWIGTQLWCGKFLELDNFVVDQTVRGQGVGKIMVEWAEQKAKTENCAMIRLDSYVTADPAHRFYFGRGFKVEGFHMTKRLS